MIEPMKLQLRNKRRDQEPYTGNRAEHVMNGATRMVAMRSRCRSMVRVARIAGTAQP